MREGNISPEERLLALIKGKGKKGAEPIAGQSNAKESKYQIQDTRKYFNMLGAVINPAVLKSINKYLTPILLILAVYLIFDIFFIKPYADIQSIISRESDSNIDSREAKEEKPIEEKGYSQYSKDIAGKMLFSPSSPLEEGSRTQITKQEGDISKDLNLVGIIAGDSPQAIIEDKKNQKTHYVTKGQSFDGFIIDEVSDGKVVLDYGGKKITLVL